MSVVLPRRKDGLSLDAAALEAGAAPRRLVLLTARVLVFGSAFMVSDPVFGGLVISLIFGALASTALTLFVIPLIYFRWQRGSQRKRSA